MLVAAALTSTVPSTAHAQSADTRTAGYVTIGAGSALVSVGAVFMVLSLMQTQHLQEFANSSRDSSTGLPLVNYSDVQAVETQRATDLGLSIGFFAVGAIALVTGTLLAVHPACHSGSRVAIAPAPGGLRVTF
jgi:hypothetical protein